MTVRPFVCSGGCRCAAGALTLPLRGGPSPKTARERDPGSLCTRLFHCGVKICACRGGCCFIRNARTPFRDRAVCVRDSRPQGRDAGAPAPILRIRGEDLARRRLGAVGNGGIVAYGARSPARSAAEGHARIRLFRFCPATNTSRSVSCSAKRRRAMLQSPCSTGGCASASWRCGRTRTPCRASPRPAGVRAEFGMGTVCASPHPRALAAKIGFAGALPRFRDTKPCSRDDADASDPRAPGTRHETPHTVDP